MSNTRELRRRIKSVKNTSQITKAMQMVAATKMRKAQSQTIESRPYNLTLSSVIARLVPKIEDKLHPLLKQNEANSDLIGAKKVGMLVLSTNKSLCGALNTNLFRAILASHISSRRLSFYSVGKKGRDFIVRTNQDLEADFENSEIITFKQATQISKLLIDEFLKGGLGEVYLAYPHFVSTLRQEPRIVKLLPLDNLAVISNEERNLQISRSTRDDKKESQNDSEYLFEPDLNELLEYVLVHSIETQIYQALLETKASEHSARMMAMQNATDNAKELVGDLQLSYNQIRQESITRELLEITSAGLALE